MQSNSGLSGATNEIRNNHLISINDFNVAMQLNPQQLGDGEDCQSFWKRYVYVLQRKMTDKWRFFYFSIASARTSDPGASVGQVRGR
jgi:hypothetical protein